MLKIIYPLSSPKVFYELSAKYSAWLWTACVLFAAYGLIFGLGFAPADYQQGDAFRIIYIHVPCAALSLAVYTLIAIYSSIYLIWRIKLMDILAKVSVPIGASFTFLALITGSLWGKPMWGTWWIWDARLTSELILFFLYLGVFALRSAIPEPDKQRVLVRSWH
jgi:heme exporter protein C